MQLIKEELNELIGVLLLVTFEGAIYIPNSLFQHLWVVTIPKISCLLCFCCIPLLVKKFGEKNCKFTIF